MAPKRTIIIALLLLVTVFVAYLFIQSRTVEFVHKVAEITLQKDTIVKHKAIYPTKLLSVDPTQKKAIIEVDFPDHGWKKFEGKENELIEGLGYYIYRIEDDRIIITVGYPG